jgi:hypothetical protein
MAIKSLISQARQIRASEGYKDLNFVDGLQGARELAGDVHNAAVAEGTTYLEEDINHLRTQVKEIIGKTFWYDQTSISLEELASTGNKTIIQPVQTGAITLAAGSVDLTSIASGSGAEASGTTVGYVFTDDTTATVDTKAKVMLRDKVTNMPIVDEDENIIYGILTFDGADGDAVTGAAGGLLSVKTYKDVDGVSTAVAYDGEVEAIIPQRVNFADSAEDFAMVNAGFAGSVGAIELGDRLWVALDPATGNYDLVAESGDNADLGITKDDNLTKVINALIGRASDAGTTAEVTEDLIGHTLNPDGTLATDLDVEWDGDGVNTHYLDNDAGAGTTTILDALKVLDNTLKTVEDLAKEAAGNTQVEILAADIASGTAWTIPNAVQVITGDKDACKVFVNGQLLISDFMVSGTAGDGSGDYTVSSNTEVTFNFDLLAGDVITIEVLKEFVV